MTESEYRCSDGISRSELWRLRDSPEKFIWFQQHPEPPTPALVFGAAVHKLLLEEESFADEFSLAPECDRRSKAGKEEYNAFLKASEGKRIISVADFEKATEMVYRIRKTPFTKKLLSGEHEKPFFWTDELTGELCKIRVDCISEIKGSPVVIDYKTTSDASTDGFMRSAIKYGYDFQAGMYCEGVERATGKKPLFVFIAQEKNPPYSVNILQADDGMIRRGYDTFRELIGIYHECATTGNWYGYLGAYEMINELSLPNWLTAD